jgi:hypothetical protein
MNNMITRIMETYSNRMLNEREVPDYLQKQIEGIWLAGEDFDKGVQLIIDGLQDERSCIMELEEKI